jgi:hypothetical protein
LSSLLPRKINPPTVSSSRAFRREAAGNRGFDFFSSAGSGERSFFFDAALLLAATVLALARVFDFWRQSAFGGGSGSGAGGGSAQTSSPSLFEALIFSATEDLPATLDLAETDLFIAVTFEGGGAQISHSRFWFIRKFA